MNLTSTAAQCPLYVDMDGTLIATDCLWESLLLMVKRKPLDALRIPLWWLGHGRAYMKEEVARRVLPDVTSLPYRPAVVEFIKQQKAEGRQVVLATASNRHVAQAVADYLGIFDGVVASGPDANLSGKRKLQVIEEQVGSAGFGYMGNSSSDLPLWQAAKEAYVVAPNPGVLARARALCTPKQVFESPSRPLAWLKAMRPKQWVKNILLVLPLFMAHKVGDVHKLQAVLLGIMAMCLGASSIYLLNDLIDLEADRVHHRKRNRPLASGDLSIPAGLAMLIFLVPLSFLVAACVGQNFYFMGMLAVYLLVSITYAFYFKQRLLLDVIVLAGLYTHRILAGAVAVWVPVSQWLLAFSMFLFTSLAFVKRYSELSIVKESTGAKPRGRSYMIDDLEIIGSVGPTSGYLAVLVFCLYINDTAGALYKHPRVLWFICPVLLYWITRIWFFARRRKLDDDPVIFAVRDRVSWIAGILAALIVFAARPR